MLLHSKIPVKYSFDAGQLMRRSLRITGIYLKQIKIKQNSALCLFCLHYKCLLLEKSVPEPSDDAASPFALEKFCQNGSVGKSNT